MNSERTMKLRSLVASKERNIRDAERRLNIVKRTPVQSVRERNERSQHALAQLNRIDRLQTEVRVITELIGKISPEYDDVAEALMNVVEGKSTSEAAALSVRNKPLFHDRLKQIQNPDREFRTTNREYSQSLKEVEAALEQTDKMPYKTAKANFDQGIGDGSIPLHDAAEATYQELKGAL